MRVLSTQAKIDNNKFVIQWYNNNSTGSKLDNTLLLSFHLTHENHHLQTKDSLKECSINKYPRYTPELKCMNELCIFLLPNHSAILNRLKRQSTDTNRI